MDFVSRPTTETAKALLGVKVIYEDEFQTYSGYIVETEAYLGFTDRRLMDLEVSKRQSDFTL